MKHRLDRKTFYGLPLTLFSVSVIYLLFLFGGIVANILNSDIIVSIDIHTANLLAIFRNTELTKFFFWITLLGKWQVILSFTIASVLILLLWEKRSYIIPLLLSLTGSIFFTSIGKFIFHRPRPGVAIYPENTFSFPSGHAAISVAFYGFLAYLIIRTARRRNIKINVFFSSFILIMLIGFSRLYLGVHYISDVWGGYLTGAIWLIIAVSLSEYFLYIRPKENLHHSALLKKLTSVILIAVSLSFYIIFVFRYRIPDSIISRDVKVNMIKDTADIFLDNQLKYTEKISGSREEPLGFIIIAKNDQNLIDLFENSGWLLAENVTIPNLVKLIPAALWKEPYPGAPITPDFWNANVHDFGFEKSAESNNVRSRHHARFWKTKYITEDGYAIYVGKASFDKGIKWGITHQINPDLDTEREFLFRDLQKSGMIANSKKLHFVDPVLGSNFTGDLFFTDGKLYQISIIK